MQAFGRELGGVAVAALIYYLVRGAVSDRAEEAFDRARGLLDLERTLGIDWELGAQAAILDSQWLIDLANGAYFWGHMPLLIVLALWLWGWQRPLWRWFRNALLASALIGMCCYFAFPTAPPRLLPELGYVDTLTLRAAPAYQAQEVGLFVNPYAALPSLHVGWALLAGAACWLVARERRGRSARMLWTALAVAIPLSQLWAVTATGNHWTLDAAAGAVVAAAAWWISPWLALRIGRIDRLRGKISGNRHRRAASP